MINVLLRVGILNKEKTVMVFIFCMRQIVVNVLLRVGSSLGEDFHGIYSDTETLVLSL